MALNPGTRLGGYEIVEPLGTGGMGVVYRARDSKLNRDVAIKVLLPAVANDPDRLARFSREAQVLGSLNHSNIAQIYGIEDADGLKALVLELVEGEDLAQRIARGPIALDEALPIAKQIAEALEAAHERGIVHRDLKPANIKVRSDGTVKVLDFGLAKAIDPAGASSANAMNSPTLSMHATEAGIILGTAAYMSPEQARGKSVDKRADIWAFGVVLFEMITGQRLFEGETVSDTLAAVLTHEPAWNRAPANVQPLLRRCLEKEPTRRLRDIGDAMALLADTHAAPEMPRPHSKLALTLGTLAVVGTLAAAGLAIVRRPDPPPLAQPVQFDIAPPGKSVFGNGLSVSPDGRQVAFIADSQIWVRGLDSTQPRLLAGTEGATTALVWSPDSRFLLFATQLQVRKVDASGGPAQTLCGSCSYVRGAAWSRDGVVLIVGIGGVLRITETGGTPTPVAVNSGVHGDPYFLRDGRHFLYAWQRGIDIGFLDAPAASASQKPSSQPLLTTDSAAFLYAPSADGRDGQMLFQRDGALLTQHFDGVTLELTGPVVPVAENVGSFGASSTRVLAYRARNIASGSSRLLWYDRDGKQVGQLGPLANYGNLALSSDGKTVMVDRSESNSSHMWAGDVARGVFSRPNPGGSEELSPCSLPDGRMAFTYSPLGTAGDIYVSAANGTGVPEAWVKSENIKHVNQCSPDGRFLIYDDHNGTQRQDLWILPVPAPGSRPGKPIPFLASSADETFGQFSPDGKWVAYVSDETGRREVYVREFAPDRSPAVGAGKWLVSTAGGDKPRWRHDGRELFYIAPDKKMMAVSVKPAAVFEPGLPEPLFDVETTGFAPYDVGADGRFLINTPLAASAIAASSITVMLNWTAGLKK
ncbi:MAG: serine/threonine protein kinase [Acidobacteria bacterium]|nr:serine/threonine protein kinase [Acidobacteriota bacterium]